MGLGIGIGIGIGKQRSASARAKEQFDDFSHELILPTELLNIHSSQTEGAVVTALSFPWIALLEQLQTNPDLLLEFSRHPRVFEEFIAATYDKAGFHVTLTPRSGDGGKDIIAEKFGFGSIRILDQCKAFKRDHKVNPNDVRAMMGTMMLNTNASKAVVTTTSVFAPSVQKEWANFIPFRLELREGKDILDWIKSIDDVKVK